MSGSKEPSQALPPHQAALPRSRAAIANESDTAIAQGDDPTATLLRLHLEVLLDLRDLVSECAWRLSDITGALDEE